MTPTSNRLRTASLLTHSVIHTRPRQLAARLWFTVKRRALTLASPNPSAETPPPVRQVLPESPLPKQESAIRPISDGYELTFQNRTRAFGVAIDWHRADLNAGTRLWKLHLHYHEFLAGLPDAELIRIVSDWLSANPPYRPQYWLDSWNAYAVSIRSVVWMQEYAKRKDRLPVEFRNVLLSAIWQHLRFLRGNLENDIGGNHILRNIRALMWGAAFFDGDAASRLGAFAERLLVGELADQVLPDGFHFERSPSYHLQVFGDLLECWRVARAASTRQVLGDILGRMAKVVANVAHPDGNPSLFGDGGFSMAHRPHELLNVYSGQLGAAPMPSKTFWYQQAGYAGLRTGDTYLIYDCGPVAPGHLPAHAHADIFSFELSLGQRRIVVDSGTYEYDPGERRSWYRGTAAHNTVGLDDKDQCEMWSSFRMGRRGNVVLERVDIGSDRLAIEGWHDGYTRLRGAPVHHRLLDADARGVRIADRVVGGAGQNARSFLHLHPECRVESLGPGVARIIAGRVRLKIQASGHLSIEQFQWSTDFGIAIPSQRLVVAYGRVPCLGQYELMLE